MDDIDASHAPPYPPYPPYSPYQAEPKKLQKKGLVHQILRWLLGVGVDILMLILMVVAAVFFFAPVVVAVIAAGMAGVSGVMSLLSLWHAFAAGRYNAVLSGMPALVTATKIAFASIAYLALLFALNALIAGIIGQRKRHFYLAPGLILSTFALLACAISSYLLIGELAAATGWGELPFVVFFGYLGADAALLGLLTTDLRPAVGGRKQIPSPRGRRQDRSSGTKTVLALAPGETVAIESVKVAVGGTNPTAHAGDPDHVGSSRAV